MRMARRVPPKWKKPPRTRHNPPSKAQSGSVNPENAHKRDNRFGRRSYECASRPPIRRFLGQDEQFLLPPLTGPDHVFVKHAVTNFINLESSLAAIYGCTS